ncbi:glycosyltransferase family 4 protein [Herpetosiphon geysericola]|uniref:Glycosyl transferase family 1 n=1 Tax=Herpetosiphon geysericola TaxID=70996 RepID=A0A0P6XRU2_9CHLR|nr:glycosyltransferase family 4 protein [Herpetosiphon geysericola]KPL86920.1 glycosyl transferase family 1 [Herpetosiphon geysericola]
MPTPQYPSIRSILLIGNYAPRQCGIATYTTDLRMALLEAYPQSKIDVMAMNDTPIGYDYPDSVVFTIDQDNPDSYYQAADFIRLSSYDLVCIQHEYGIFGGASGRNLLLLIRAIAIPIVTTLHTVLREPTADQQTILWELAQRSQRIIVMSSHAADLMQTIYGIPLAQIDCIPHGIPDLPFRDGYEDKQHANLTGKQVLLTFGLLSPNKGIEDVLYALPSLIQQHPQVLYVIVGATHPTVRQTVGEAYREMLQALVEQLGIQAHVRFHDHFVSPSALAIYMGAADIYITPYHSQEQSVSGTLAYAIGAGKAIVSTPYWYATELLAHGGGMLVPFHDPALLAQQINTLLAEPQLRQTIRERAYQRGRTMLWSVVATHYMRSFIQAQTHPRHPVLVLANQPIMHDSLIIPPLCLDHLIAMTDDMGLIQHAILTLPNYHEGYATDDNARALIAMMLLDPIQEPQAQCLAMRYLAFLWYAFNPATQRFRNFMGANRQWGEATGSEDAHARSIWALGTVLAQSHDPGLCGVAQRLLRFALPAVAQLTHPRPWAFALLGFAAYRRRFPGDRTVRACQSHLAEQLLARFQAAHQPDWEWFDDHLTYDNAVLPHALIVSGQTLQRPDMVAAGLTALTWLCAIQRPEADHFKPIGSNGFFQRGHAPAHYDQQPIEAQATVLAACAAFESTGDSGWYDEAQHALSWFLGHNDAGVALYDPRTGGCADGLEIDRINQNQGAESTLAFLISRLTMQTLTPPIRLGTAASKGTSVAPPTQIGVNVIPPRDLRLSRPL